MSKHCHKYLAMVRVQIASCLNTTQLLDVDLEKVYPLIKNLLDSEIHSAPLARKAKILFKKLGKINSETKFPENGSELQNSFFGNTFQEVFPVAQESTMKKEL